MMRGVVTAAVVLLLASSAAMGQWSENFDSYALGTSMHGQGGWYGWDNVPGAAGTVSDDFVISAPHAIKASNSFGNDTVHPFSGYTDGQWVFTAYHYIPSGLDGLTYFILNNEYNHNGSQDWGIEMHMDPGTGMVTEAIHDQGLTTPIVYDQWVEIRTEIDLDNNYVEAYYNGTMLANGQWNIRSNGLIELQAVDLYAPHDEPVYFDNLSLVPEPAACMLLAAGALLLRRR
jgi:hypothetical protein